jgi:hypothetical protein
VCDIFVVCGGERKWWGRLKGKRMAETTKLVSDFIGYVA